VISVTVALAVMHHVDLVVTLLVATVISVTVALVAIHLADLVQTHVEDAQADLVVSAQAAHAQRAATNSDLSGLVSSTRPLTFCPR
jgi:spore maturation protein SpmA